MGQKKNSKIILIMIILLVTLIILIGVVYAYFTTDMFRSNKELFFKYITQMGEEQNGFMDTELKEYFEKQKNEAYSNDGTFSLNIGTESEEEYDTINNFNISFSGKNDKTNHRFLQDISLNYSNYITFPISYKKIEDIIGLQTKYVGNKYIAVKIDNLENEALTTIRDFVQATSKIEELKQSPFSKEEWKQIQEKYVKVINEQLQEVQFTKVEENNKKGYKLALTEEQIKNIIIQLLETLKNDQTVLDKINEFIEQRESSAKITTTTIDNFIKDIENETTSDEETYEITVFQEKGKTTQLSVKIKETVEAQEIEIKVEKKREDNLLQYRISFIPNLEEPDKSISLIANYTGLSTLQNVNETYEVELQGELPSNSQIIEKTRIAKESTEIKAEEEKEKVQLLVQGVKVTSYMNGDSSATITLEDLEKEKQDTPSTYANMEFEPSDEDNILITFTDTKDEFEIDSKGKIIKEPEMETEQTSNANANTNENNSIIYKYQFNNQITFGNTAEIEEFSDENAMILNNYEAEQVSDFLEKVEERIKLVNKQQMEELGLEEDENPILQMLAPFFGINLYNQAIGTINGTTSNMNELEVNTFNAKFENYESTNLQGVTVKGLLSTIQLNNESQENNRQIKEIHFDGEEFEGSEQNISYIKSSIETENYYRVEFERDENTGLIYRTVINKK